MSSVFLLIQYAKNSSCSFLFIIKEPTLCFHCSLTVGGEKIQQRIFLRTPTCQSFPPTFTLDVTVSASWLFSGVFFHFLDLRVRPPQTGGKIHSLMEKKAQVQVNTHNNSRGAIFFPSIHQGTASK